MIGERGPEAVVPLEPAPGASSLSGGATYVFNFPNYIGSKQELVAMLRAESKLFERHNGRPAFG